MSIVRTQLCPDIWAYLGDSPYYEVWRISVKYR